MSMASLEREIMQELREISGIKKLRNKDLMEWTTGKIEPRDDEVIFFLPKTKVSCAIKKELVPKKEEEKSSPIQSEKEKEDSA